MKLCAALCALLSCAVPTLVSAEESEAHEGGNFKLGLDLVIGPGQKITDTLEVLPPGLGGAAEVELDRTLPTTESLLLAASYQVVDHFWVGARFGLSMGSVPTLADSTLVTSFSNLELEGEYELELDEDTELALSLGIALPTAQGAEPDEDAFASEIANAARHRLIQEGAAAARGFEDNALFEPGRLGFIPKLLILHRSGNLILEPYVKLESLVRVGSGTERSVLWEVVFGGLVGYQLAHIVTLALKLWGNVALHEPSESAWIAEPQVRVQLGPLRAALGVLLPVVSRFNEPTVAGVRLAAAAQF